MNERNPNLNKLSFLNYKTGNVLLQSLFGQLLSLAHSVGNSNSTNAFFPAILLEQITFLLGTIIHDIFTNSSHSQKLFFYFTVILLGFPALTLSSRYMFPKVLRPIQVSVSNSRSVALLQYFPCLPAAAIYCNLQLCWGREQRAKQKKKVLGKVQKENQVKS